MSNNLQHGMSDNGRHWDCSCISISKTLKFIAFWGFLAVFCHLPNDADFILEAEWPFSQWGKVVGKPIKVTKPRYRCNLLFCLVIVLIEHGDQKVQQTRVHPPGHLSPPLTVLITAAKKIPQTGLHHPALAAGSELWKKCQGKWWENFAFGEYKYGKFIFSRSFFPFLMNFFWQKATQKVLKNCQDGPLGGFFVVFNSKTPPELSMFDLITLECAPPRCRKGMREKVMGKWLENRVFSYHFLVPVIYSKTEAYSCQTISNSTTVSTT